MDTTGAWLIVDGSRAPTTACGVLQAGTVPQAVQGSQGRFLMDRVARILANVEGVIYAVAGVLLAATALLILGHATMIFVTHVSSQNVVAAVIELLEELLLALMAVELLYTVTVSIRTRSLSAEPFLIVGLVAAVRRVLTLSVEAANVMQNDLERFKLAMIEIGLLVLSVLILVVAIHILRRTQRPPRPNGSERPQSRRGYSRGQQQQQRPRDR
jgi:uncharacterized membrane protein (DUF373 family)